MLVSIWEAISRETALKSLCGNVGVWMRYYGMIRVPNHYNAHRHVLSDILANSVNFFRIKLQHCGSDYLVAALKDWSRKKDAMALAITSKLSLTVFSTAVIPLRMAIIQ